MTHPLLICTWFLTSLGYKLDFWTWFFVYFKLDFYCLCSLQKSNRQKIKFKNQVQKLILWNRDFKNQVQINRGTFVKQEPKMHIWDIRMPVYHMLSSFHCLISFIFCLLFTSVLYFLSTTTTYLLRCSSINNKCYYQLWPFVTVVLTVMRNTRQDHFLFSYKM